MIYVKHKQTGVRGSSVRWSNGREWNGKVYATKRVRPIFVEEAAEILVVTVYYF
ncbi:MAG: hypothetical protein ACLQOO_03725 [Terriglobia bacterium]